jgi:hypothetical protein
MDVISLASADVCEDADGRLMVTCFRVTMQI